MFGSLWWRKTFPFPFQVRRWYEESLVLDPGSHSYYDGMSRVVWLSRYMYWTPTSINGFHGREGGDTFVCALSDWHHCICLSTRVSITSFRLVFPLSLQLSLLIHSSRLSSPFDLHPFFTPTLSPSLVNSFNPHSVLFPLPSSHSPFLFTSLLLRNGG